MNPGVLQSDRSREGHRSFARRAEGTTHPFLRVLRDTVTGLPSGVVAGSLAINIMSLVLPLATLQVYDRMIPMNATETLALLLSVVAVVSLFELTLRIARTNLVTWAATRLAWRVHAEAIGRIFVAPKAWVEGEPASRILERLQALNMASEWQASPSRLALVDLPFIPVYLGILAVVGHWLVLVPVVLFVVLGLIGAARARRLRQVVEARAIEDVKLRDFLIETITGIGTIKAHAMEPQMVRRYERLQEGAARCTAETILITDEAQAFAAFSSSLSQVAMVSVGAYFAIAGSISIGTLACCTMLAGWSLQPLLRAVALLSELESITVAEAKAASILALPAGRPIAEPFPERWQPASLVVEGLTIHRPERETKPVEVSEFRVAAGEIVAISGADGGGKSTFVQAVMGTIVPRSGVIRLDGEPVAPGQDGLSRRIAMVGQRTQAVRGSVLENVAMYRPDAVEAAVEACRLIGLEAAINQLPNGYDARLSDGIAEQFSAGFLQRLAIARAIARRPGLLILDEVNTSLDMAADRALAEGLTRLKGLATILLITNRPSMAAIADRAYVMVDGSLVPAAARGTAATGASA